MESIKVYDKTFVPYIPHGRIQETVDRIALKIREDVAGKNPLFLVILNGAFMFASDLVRRLDFPLELSFIKLSSYVGTLSSNTINELIGLDSAIKDRTIVIVEDIIDSGITMGYILDKLKYLEAADVRIATLLFKPRAFRKNYHIDYIGMEIPNDFIVGYGLDYNGYGRNYPDIYQISE